MINAGHFLTEPESMALLSPYGVPFPPSVLAHSASEAFQAACQWPEPYVLKVVSRSIQHKTDIGGVRLGIAKTDVVATYADLRETVAQRIPGCDIDGILIQAQAQPGVEVIIGVKRDEAFGHVALFGAGGVLSELLNEASIRLLPFDRQEAREMVLETRVAGLLQGIRGAPPVDLEAVCDLLDNLSRAVMDNPGIMELDLNPVLLRADGLTAVDALVRATHAEDTPMRRDKQ